MFSKDKKKRHACLLACVGNEAPVQNVNSNFMFADLLISYVQLGE